MSTRTIAIAGLVLIAAGCARTLPPAPIANCSEVLAQTKVLQHYRQALDQLAQHQPPRSVAGLSCFLKPETVQRSSSTAAYQALIEQGVSSDVLYAALQQNLERNLRQDRKLNQKRDAGLAWPGAYLSEAALVAYRRTGETRFLDLFAAYFNSLLERRDDRLGRFDVQHQRVMKAWGSVNIEQDRWIAHITHNARITYPATEFARIVRKDPALAAYRDQAERFLASAEETLAEFNNDWVPVPGHPEIRWFRRPFDSNLEATNHLHVVGTAWLNLAELTGKPDYRQKLEQLIAIFQQGVHREPGGLVSWNYFPPFAGQEKNDPEFRNGQEYSEPIWKASLTAPFLLRAQQQGYKVPAELTRAIGRTFSSLSFQGDQIWRNLARKDSRFVDAQKDRRKLGFLKNTTVLIEYGSVAPELPGQISQLVALRPDLFAKGWLSSPATLLGAAYTLKPVELTPPRRPERSH